MGRPDEAVGNAERRMQYDPLTAANPHMYRWARQYQQAIDAAKILTDYDYSYLLTLCYQQLGMEEEEFQWFMQFDGDTEAKIRSYDAAYDGSGMKGVWRLFIENELTSGPREERFGYGKFFDVAATYAYLSEKDKAFDWQDKLVERPVAHPFVVDPRFDSLRSDPRFEELLRKLKLPEEAIQRHLALYE